MSENNAAAHQVPTRNNQTLPQPKPSAAATSGSFCSKSRNEEVTNDSHKPSGSQNKQIKFYA